jgi:hypothetical protein
MKKSIAMLLGLALISALSMAMISPAKAGISMADWRPTYISKDWGLVIYKDGETAALLISVTNDWASGYKMNISRIVISFFQIGKNKTLDLLASPHQLLYGQTQIFTVSFTASQTDFYSGIQFDYNIIVEWVNATTGPMKIVNHYEYGRWIVNYQPLFQVYPTVQADVVDSRSKLNTYSSNFPSWYFDSFLGEQKYTQAIIERNLGDTFYNREDYPSALTHYNASNTLWQEALTAEFNWRDTTNNAELNVTLTEAAARMTEANAAKATADAAITNAYGWYFIGIGFAIGWSLMGVGAVIWAWKRPKPPV